MSSLSSDVDAGNWFTPLATRWQSWPENLKVIKVVEIEEDDDDYAYIEGERERERVQNDEQIQE